MSEVQLLRAWKVFHEAVVMLNKGNELFHKSTTTRTKTKTKKNNEEDEEKNEDDSSLSWTTDSTTPDHDDLMAMTAYFQSSMRMVKAALMLARGATTEESNCTTTLSSPFQSNKPAANAAASISASATKATVPVALPIGSSRMPSRKQRSLSEVTQQDSDDEEEGEGGGRGIDSSGISRRLFLMHLYEESSSSTLFLTSSLPYGSSSLHLCVVPMRSIQNNGMHNQVGRRGIEWLSRIVLAHAMFSLAVAAQLLCSDSSYATGEQRAKYRQSAMGLYEVLLKLRVKDSTLPSDCFAQQQDSLLLIAPIDFEDQEPRSSINSSQGLESLVHPTTSCQYQSISCSTILDLSILNNASIFYFEMGYLVKCKACVQNLRLQTNNHTATINMFPTNTNSTPSASTSMESSTAAFRRQSQEFGHLFRQNVDLLHYLLHVAPATAA